MFVFEFHDGEPVDSDSVDLIGTNERHPPDPAVVAAQAGRTVRQPTPRDRRRRRGQTHRARGPPDDDIDSGIDAYTIEQFCDRHNISKSFYFLLMKEGRGPRVMRVGRRTLISREAAAVWRRQQERAIQKSGTKTV